MNAMRRPSAPLKRMAVISPYLACTQMNTRLSIVRTAAATTVSAGCQWRAAGTTSPTVQTSSRMPRAVTPSLTLSNRKTFMTSDADVQERGENLQDPQQDVHRVPLPGFRLGAG